MLFDQVEILKANTWVTPLTLARWPPKVRLIIAGTALRLAGVPLIKRGSSHRMGISLGFPLARKSLFGLSA